MSASVKEYQRKKHRYCTAKEKPQDIFYSVAQICKPKRKIYRVVKPEK